MRRLPTMLASASAAALATLAVTVAVPALADGGDGGDKHADDLAACLRDHGLDGAPDGAALKPWLGTRLERGDATAEQALADCSPKPEIRIVNEPGPSEQELRSCLTDHGVELPEADGLALKRWIVAHGDDTANRDALKACGMAPMPKPGAVAECGKAGIVTKVVPAGRARDKIATVESAVPAE